MNRDNPDHALPRRAFIRYVWSKRAPGVLAYMTLTSIMTTFPHSTSPV